jgi:hypothetical protein
LEFKVGLRKSRTVALAEVVQEPLATQFAESFTQHPASPRTVAETSTITSVRTTDLIAVFESVSEARVTQSGKPEVTVELIDRSAAKGGLPAIVFVSVIGSGKLSSSLENTNRWRFST